MLKFKSHYIFVDGLALLCACKSKSNKNYNYNQAYYFKKGSFGYDLDFLKKKDSIVLLKSSDGLSEVIISPKYQGKIFTSTADGDEGKSFGWVNYKAFNGTIDLHMNAYGGEDRLWVGPEGGKFALFFKQGAKMEFANWFTPAPIDHESWTVIGKDDKQVSLNKNMSLTNYLGTRLDIEVNRQIGIMSQMEIEKALGIQLDTTVKTVGIKTNNTLTNASSKAWTKLTGAPCLWDLDMFTPSPQVTIVIPYKADAKGKVATTDYFGQIPANRVNYKNGHLFFKADGKSRGKLGMPAGRSTAIAGSYDATNNVLTITQFDVDSRATYS